MYNGARLMKQDLKHVLTQNSTGEKSSVTAAALADVIR